MSTETKNILKVNNLADYVTLSTKNAYRNIVLFNNKETILFGFFKILFNNNGINGKARKPSLKPHLYPYVVRHLSHYEIDGKTSGRKGCRHWALQNRETTKKEETTNNTNNNCYVYDYHNRCYNNHYGFVIIPYFSHFNLLNEIDRYNIIFLGKSNEGQKSITSILRVDEVFDKERHSDKFGFQTKAMQTVSNGPEGRSCGNILGLKNPPCGTAQNTLSATLNRNYVSNYNGRLSVHIV